MTAARLLLPHLKAQPDPTAVLASAAGKTRRQVEVLIASLSPMPDAPTVIRKLPAPALTAPVQAASSTLSQPAAPTRPAPAATVAPLSPDRYRLQVTIGGEAVEKLRLAQDMLSHAVPAGDAAAVLERALDALLDQLARQRFSATEDPRERRPAADGEGRSQRGRDGWTRSSRSLQFRHRPRARESRCGHRRHRPARGSGIRGT